MITANEIKIKGIKAFDEELKVAKEVGITVRGKVKYVVMTVEEYDKRRELELDLALLEINKEIKDRNFITSIDQHFEEIDEATKE